MSSSESTCCLSRYGARDGLYIRPLVISDPCWFFIPRTRCVQGVYFTYDQVQSITSVLQNNSATETGGATGTYAYTILCEPPTAPNRKSTEINESTDP